MYRGPDLPWIPGTEGAGIIEAAGVGVEPGWIGERVVFWAMPPVVSGTYAEYAVAPVSSLFRLGPHVSYDHGAALPLQGLTAYGVVHLAAKIEAGQTVLIHAAGGGVGLLAVQLAKRAGARVLGSVSSAAKAEAVRALGGETLEYGEDLARRVLDATGGRGVDVVLDSVGRATQDVSLKVLARFALLLFYGDASGPATAHRSRSPVRTPLKIGSFTLDVNHCPELWQEIRQELLRLVEEGSLRLTISAVLPLAGAAEAHRRLESRQSFGEIVLDIG